MAGDVFEFAEFPYDKKVKGRKNKRSRKPKKKQQIN